MIGNVHVNFQTKFKFKSDKAKFLLFVLSCSLNHPFFVNQTTYKGFLGSSPSTFPQFRNPKTLDRTLPPSFGGGNFPFCVAEVRIFSILVFLAVTSIAVSRVYLFLIWGSVMGSRKEDEKNEKIIRGLMKLPPNRRCINCNSLVNSTSVFEFDFCFSLWYSETVL